MRTLGKRLISLLLCLVMLLTLFPVQALAAESGSGTAAADSPFADVKKEDWFYDAVLYAYANGFFGGTSATTYEPQGALTRGMFVAVLGRMAGVDTSGYTGLSRFSDVPNGKYYAPYVAWAVAHGIVTGYADGSFRPNAPVTRQQMAAFFVRYFEAFGVNYETGANHTTTPADMALVAAYAKDAVLKLWKQGLLNGDGVNFNPGSSASRAQAATLCMRADKAVDTWYAEPGVPSRRISVDPAAQQPAPSAGGAVSASAGGGSSSGGSDDSSSDDPYSGKNYTITLRMPDGSTATVTQSTSVLDLSGLVTPTRDGYYFLGWYYDEQCTRQAMDGDTLSARTTTLYPKMLKNGEVETSETPYYVVSTDVAVSFTVTAVSSSSADLTDQITFTGPEQIDRDGNASILTVTRSGNTYTVSGPGGKLAPGGTYRVVLEDDALSFAGQAGSVREYHFTVTASEPVMNLHLKESVKEIPLSALGGITQNGTQVESMSMTPVSLRAGRTTGMENPAGTGTGLNEDTGTFTYTGAETLRVGDTLAVYEGTAPEQRDETTTDLSRVSYVTITAVEGNTYTYTAATTEDVVFTPDVLTVSSSYAGENGAASIPLDALIFANALAGEANVDSAASVDVGDFLAFYTGENYETAESVTYGCITGVAITDQGYEITYTDAQEGDVLSAMDVATENDVDGDDMLRDADIAALEEDLEAQAVDSGFAQAVALNLAAAVSEMDLSGLDGEPLDMSGIDLSEFDLSGLTGRLLDADGTFSTSAVSVKYAGEAGGGGTGPEITIESVRASISKNLQHFKNKSGVRVSLEMKISIEFDAGEEGESIIIELTPTFVQELKLSIKTSGGAKWKWKWIFPYIYDFYARVSVDMYTYTSIDLNATISSGGEDDTPGKVKDLVDGVKGVVRDMKAVFDNGNIEVTESISDLQDLYSQMLENDTEWITLYRKSISQNEWVVAKIIKINLDVDFVVQGNVNISLGLEFDYENAKRYIYMVYIFHGEATSDTINLVTESYNLQLYAMGVLGIRAGVETCLSVSLISKKVASVGVVVNVGVYLKVYGYVVYRLHHTAGQPNTSSGSGALYIEVGCYLDIGLDISAFAGKLSWKPTLYSKEWPLWSAGSSQAVTGFTAALKDNDEEEGGGEGSGEDADLPVIYMKKGYVQGYLPQEFFKMAGFDLRTGADASKSYIYSSDLFDITFDNGRFEIYETGDRFPFVVPIFGDYRNWKTCSEPMIEDIMTIEWKGAPLSFNTEPIQLRVKLHWDRLEDGYYVSYDTGVAAAVSAQKLQYGDAITPPDISADGYLFGGWYTDAEYKTPFAAGTTMPEENVILHARWIPRTDVAYTVVPMLQKADGTYTEGTPYTWHDGRVDTYIIPKLKDISGYVTPGVGGYYIRGDGSSRIAISYPRQSYRLELDDNGAISYLYYDYGDEIELETPARAGYTFNGWTVQKVDDSGKTTTLSAIPATMPAYRLKLTARWTANTNTPYTVKYSLEDVDGQILPRPDLTETRYGTTDEVVLVKATNRDGYYTQPEQYVTIRGDGSTVVEFTYGLRNYDLTLNYGDGRANGGTWFKYGEVITLDTPTRAGYVFDGWYTDSGLTTKLADDATMPDRGMTLYARWTAGAGIAYKVEHYQQNAAGEGYTLAATEDLTGTAGTQTAASAKTYTGFTAQAVTQEIIAGGGNTVVKIYYDRERYTLTYVLNDASAALNGTSGGTHRHGAEITTPIPTTTRADYTFEGWFTDAALTRAFNGTMPMENTTLYAKWTAGSMRYTVKHYLQALDGTYSAEPSSTTFGSGNVGDTVTPQPGSYEGFTAPTAASLILSAVESENVVTYQYVRNTYTLTWDARNEEAAATDTVKYGAAVTKLEEDPVRAGYTFGGWYTDTGCTTALTDAYTMPACDQTIYARWTPITYTLRFNADGNAPLRTWLLAQPGAVETGAILNDTNDQYLNNGIPYIDIPMTYGETFALPGESVGASSGVTGFWYEKTTCAWITEDPWGAPISTPYWGPRSETQSLSLGASIQNATYLDGTTVQVDSIWPVMNGDWDNKSTAEDPAKIYSASQFFAVFADSTSYYYPYSELMVDLIVNNRGLPSATGVGQQGTQGGCFDGNGHTIKTMTLDMWNGDGSAAGVFGPAIGSGYTVKNVTVENIAVTYATEAGDDPTYAPIPNGFGGLVRMVGDGFTMSNVTVKDLTMDLTLMQKTEYRADYTNCLPAECVGGLIGYADGTVTLENCTVTGLTMNVTLREDNENAVGCLIGYVNGPASNVTITGCTFPNTVGGYDQIGVTVNSAPAEETT